MSKLDFDPIDAALTVGLAMSGFIMTGIATFSLFDVSFGDTVFTLGSYDISYAYGMSAGAIVGTVITNDNTEFSSLSDDIQGLQGYYMIAAISALALPIAFILLPDTVGSFFTGSDLWGVLYVVLVTSGQTALGWML